MMLKIIKISIDKQLVKLLFKVHVKNERFVMQSAPIISCWKEKFSANILGYKLSLLYQMHLPHIDPFLTHSSRSKYQVILN